MVLYLQEDQSFTLTANLTTPGPVRVVPTGFLTKTENGEQWVAPLIPQLFYGYDGTQLTTWRQTIPVSGEQTILSRGAGGYPKVPDEELWWRKATEEKEEVVAEAPRPLTFAMQWANLPTWQKLLIGVGVVSAVVGIGYILANSFK